MYAVTVTCVDCDVDAAGVGFDGYLGTPSLSTELPAKLNQVDGEDFPFGYLYEPLQAILLRPQDLEDMHAFLSAHQKHQVVMWSSQAENDWPPELVALLARRETKHPDQAGRGRDDDAIVCVADEQQLEWIFGHYLVRCLDCRKKYELNEPELLRAFDAQPLAPKAVDMMLSRWGKLAPDDGWNHALKAAVDPYEASMQGLLKFLKRHRVHRLEARVRPVGR